MNPIHKPFVTVAGIYDDYRQKYSSAAIEHIKTLTNLTITSKILDLACGTGLVLRGFLDTSEIYGLDLSLEMLAQAKQQYCQRHHVYLTNGNGETLPFPPHSFDLVIIGQAIHWFNLDRLVPELQRVLKANAWFAIISKYPSPREPYRPLFEYILDKVNRHTEAPDYKLKGVYGVGNILGLEQAGFTQYERMVFENRVEYPVEIYLKGCATDPIVQSLEEPERTLFLEEMKCAANRLAKNGLLQETLLEYVITMKYVPT